MFSFLTYSDIYKIPDVMLKSEESLEDISETEMEDGRW